MPIKPMDMQVMLPNIRKAAKPENVKNSREEMSLQQDQMKEKHKIEINKNKVSNLEKKDENDIKKDQSNKNKSTLKKKQKEKKDFENNESIINDVNHGSKFDIKV